MKAKKSNAMWGVTLFLILGFAYFLNATDFLSKPLFPEAPKEDPNASGPSMAQTNKAIRDKIASNQQPKTSAGGAPVGDTPFTVPTEPAIFKPKPKRYDPIVNETSTAAHWDSKGSYIEQKREEVKKKRGF